MTPTPDCPQPSFQELGALSEEELKARVIGVIKDDARALYFATMGRALDEQAASFNNFTQHFAGKRSLRRAILESAALSGLDPNATIGEVLRAEGCYKEPDGGFYERHSLHFLNKSYPQFFVDVDAALVAAGFTPEEILTLGDDGIKLFREHKEKITRARNILILQGYNWQDLDA